MLLRLKFVDGRGLYTGELINPVLIICAIYFLGNAGMKSSLRFVAFSLRHARLLYDSKPKFTTSKAFRNPAEELQMFPRSALIYRRL